MTKQFARYESYKDSGVEWLGQVPAHWEIKRVKSLFRLIVEPAPVNNQQILLSLYTDIGVKPRSELEERGNKASTTDGYLQVKKDDIVVNKLLAWMGAVGVSNYDGVTSPAYDIIRPFKQINSVFYHYLFRNQIFVQEMKRYSRGIMDMRLRLYFDKFGEIFLPVPTFQEQVNIVQYIEKVEFQINEAIAQKEKMIELLKEYRQVTINNAVTKGLDPNVPMKDSGIEWLGQIPVHWQIKSLKHCATMKSGDNLTSLEITEEGFYPVYGGNGQRGFYKAYNKEGNYLLIGRQGALCGNVHFVSGKFWATEHALVTVVNSDIVIKWYYYMLSFMNLGQYSESAAQPGIGVEIIKNLITCIPGINEQYKIVDFLDKKTTQIDEAIGLKKAEIANLNEYKATLIDSAVTGKIKV